MITTHKISLDMLRPEMPERMELKQGDTYTRRLEIQLFSDGEPFSLDENVQPILRWRACHPDTGEAATGICDTLPNGNEMFQVDGNKMRMILPPQMLSLPGLVQADLVLVNGGMTLATFNFEFYVNRPPVDGTEPEAGNYYKLITLDQINAAITALQTWQAALDENFAHLEHEVFELKEIVYNL